jgi:hypothetical protein
MATTYTYPDAYLSRFCTEDVETRATADVALLGTFPAEWAERLVIVQAYIIACLENQADAEDLFTAKLKSYRQHFDVLLPQAKAAEAAAADDDAPGVGLFSIPLERA